MKKTFIFIISIMFVFCFSFSTVASSEETFEYNYNDFSVIFDNNTPFNGTQRQYISNVLANDGSATEPAGILCIFGHDWLEDSVTTITHCVRDGQPRCLEETFDIYMCSRCEKTKTELFAERYIFCCD